MPKQKKKHKRKVNTLCSPLSHPLRVRILEVVNETPLSPVAFVKKGLAPGFKSHQHALSQISYHFRELEKAGCISIDTTVQRRGATEHIFKGHGYALSKASAGSARERAKLLKASALGLIARIAGAIDQGTFESEIGKRIEWQAVCLDRQGWSEVRKSLERCSVEQKRIWKAAGQRLEKESADQPIPGTVALLSFESPRYSNLEQNVRPKHGE